MSVVVAMVVVVAVEVVVVAVQHAWGHFAFWRHFVKLAALKCPQNANYHPWKMWLPTF